MSKQSSDKCQKWRSIEDVYAHVEAHHTVEFVVLDLGQEPVCCYS